MGIIRVLSDQIANKIAAGEVVERPASVAKELIENALDAGARSIRIEADGGGAKRLRVTDDGRGMTRDDALLSLERHATSKLEDEASLSAIATLGFRGEALPAIASVSHFTLETAPPGDGAGDAQPGTRIEIAAGRVRSVEEAGLPAGTSVTVANLFANIPARRKFLKSDSTELGHITTLVTHYALAYPEVEFRLETAKRSILTVSPAQSHSERLEQIFGGELLEQCVEFRTTVAWSSSLEDPGDSGESVPGMGVYGFASRPELQKLNRNSIFIFVNRRLVRDRLLQHAIGAAYANLLPNNTYPAVLLFVDLPYAEVDVNVHPSKTEVRFRRQNWVHDGVREAIRRALGEARPVPGFLQERAARPTAGVTFGSGSGAGSIGALPWTAGGRWSPGAYTPGAFPPGRGADPNLGISIEDLPPGFNLTPAPVPPMAQRLPLEAMAGSPGALAAAARVTEARAGAGYDPAGAGGGWVPETGVGCGLRETGATGPADAEELALLRPLGQIHESFIVAAGPSGLWLIDQHVAHERVLFEQLLEQRREQRVESQRLLMPLVINLDPGRMVGFGELAEELEAAGFEAEVFGKHEIAVQAAPAGIKQEQVERLLQELLEVAVAEERETSLERIRTRITATIACHAAVKVNMRLEPEKMEWLLARLAETAYPMTCPHGRPVMLRYSIEEIQRAFKRIK